MKSRQELLMEYREKKKQPLQNTTNTQKVKTAKQAVKVAKPVATVKKPVKSTASVAVVNKEEVAVTERVSDKAEQKTEDKPLNTTDFTDSVEFQTNDHVLLSIEIDTKNQEIQLLRNLTTRLQTELEEVKQDLVQYSSKEEELLLRLETEKQNSEKVVESLTLKLQEQRDVLQDKESLIEQLSNMIDTLKTEILELNQKPKQFADVWISKVKVEELETKNSKLDQELLEKVVFITRLEAENERLKSALEVAEVDNEKVNAKNAELQSENKDLMERLFAERQHSKVQFSEFSHSILLKEQEILALKQVQPDAKIEQELKDAYECIDLLEQHELKAEKEIEEFESKILTLESQLLSQTILANTHASNEAELQNALEETLNENEQFHKEITKNKCRIQELEYELDNLQEASELMEKEMIELEKEVKSNIDKEATITELESQIVAKTITLELLEEEKNQLEQALQETIKENEFLHDQVNSIKGQLLLSQQRVESYIQSVGENLEKFLEAKEKLQRLESIAKNETKIMNEETCQTDLDINRLEAEAMNALKAVKIAQLANNVIAQQKDSDKAEYENELSILAQEQQSLKKIIEEQSELETRLIKGIEKLKVKNMELEQQLQSQ